MSYRKPIIVDLDGSLIKTDLLFESLLGLLKKNILRLLFLPFWCFRGKAYFKSRVALYVDIDVTLLPYNDAVLAAIKEYKNNGHRCYLATGSAEKYAKQISNYLALFDGVFSSDVSKNLTGNQKVAVLNEKFGKGTYLYVGNHSVDLAVWQDADEALVVSHSHALFEKAKKLTSKASHIHCEAASIKDYLKAMRIHQWVKNALVFVPLLTSHTLMNIEPVILSILGFIAYSLAASSVYILNDLVDLEADRQHPSKSKRPFASGKVPLLHGCLLCLLLCFLAFMLAFTCLPMDFFYALIAYYLLTLAYYFYVKRIIMLDTVMLAVLYTMRIIAGTLLISVDFSFWLLAFSMFIFFSLALVKRYTELLMMQEKVTEAVLGRGYHASDADMVSSLGAASGYIAVMVFALYVNSDEVAMLYSQPPLLWFACLLLLYWISRVWLIAHRGKMHDDPIVFAVKDGQSLLTAFCILAVFVAAMLL